MAIDRTPVLKRCRQLGIDPAELGYSSKKESIRQPNREFRVRRVFEQITV